MRAPLRRGALANDSAVNHNATAMKNDYPQLRAFLRSLGTPDKQEDFARRCETSVSYLRKAMSKGAKMDVKLVERIVVNSGFTVSPEELRGDVEWSVFQLEHGGRAIGEQPAPVAAVRRSGGSGRMRAARQQVAAIS
jgi:hypothetical protein